VLKKNPDVLRQNGGLDSCLAAQGIGIGQYSSTDNFFFVGLCNLPLYNAHIYKLSFANSAMTAAHEVSAAREAISVAKKSNN